MDNVFNHEQTKVLVVDDCKYTLFFLEEVLCGLGCVVIAFNDSLAALNYIKTNDMSEFNFVLTDQRMPNISGWEISDQCRLKKITGVLMTCEDADTALSHQSPNTETVVLQKPVCRIKLQALFQSLPYRSQ